MQPTPRYWFPQPSYSRDATTARFLVRELCPDPESAGALLDQLSGPGGPELRLDFGPVEALSSAALALLLKLRRRLLGAGRRLVLCNLGPRLEEVFARTRLDGFFDIRPGGSAVA